MLGDLNLKIYELQAIATALDRLVRSGIRTDSIIVGETRVGLRWEEDPTNQRDPGYWVITSITRT